SSQRALAPLLEFIDQREREPERRRRRGERNAQRRVAARREGHIARGSYVADPAGVSGEPFRLGKLLPIALGILQYGATISGVPAGDWRSLVALRELLARRRARELEQAIIGDLAADIGGHQGFRDQIDQSV